MAKIFKESYSLLNMHIKEIVKFFTMIIFGTMIGSFIFPIGGHVLSIGIFIYATQIIMRFVETKMLNVEELDEPYYSGIIKSYGFNILLGIPVIIIAVLSIANLFTGLISLSFKSIFFSSFKEGFFRLISIFIGSFSLIAFAILFMKLICPFAHFVFLDKDFKNNSFFKNIALSFKLANKYRFKVFLLLILNSIFVFISMFTFGLALIYFYPLYLIMLSKLYFESKNTLNVSNTF